MGIAVKGRRRVHATRQGGIHICRTPNYSRASSCHESLAEMNFVGVGSGFYYSLAELIPDLPKQLCMHFVFNA